jgi:hypothetical protein
MPPAAELLHYVGHLEQMMMFRTIAAVILTLTFNVDSMRGQTFRGAIQGTVNDSSGSLVPNAQVTVTGEQTHFVRQVVTDAYGNYSFTGLPVGSYRVTAQRVVSKSRSLPALK